jgi:Zn-dependent protease
VAYRGGDYTVKDKGYLTFNPLHYTHPIYSLLLPVVFLLMGGIGLPGGAVYINDSLLRSRGWRTAVSLAGPAMNVGLIWLLSCLFWLGLVDANFGPALAFLIELQICAVILNLLPVPPLDGFRALSPWLPQEMTERLLANANIFMWGLFIALWYVAPVSRSFWGLTHSACVLLGIDPVLASDGWAEFQFWRR